jgi:hypothetical protein
MKIKPNKRQTTKRILDFIAVGVERVENAGLLSKVTKLCRPFCATLIDLPRGSATVSTNANIKQLRLGMKQTERGPFFETVLQGLKEFHPTIQHLL